MVEQNITDNFISLMREISCRTFDEHINHIVSRCLLDYLGVTFAGANFAKDKLSAYISDVTSKSDGKVSLVGFGAKSDLQTAVLVNGFSSHVVELDDGHRFGMLHLEAPIFSALLGVAQKFNIDYEHFLKGVIIGYEATIRLAIALQPTHKIRGFHATGTCGTIGVACALAAALDFDNSQWKNAVAAAATSASGLLEMIDDDSQLKPYNVAHAVLAGVNAAFIGKAGFVGPKDPLGGKRGFFMSLNGEFDPDKLLSRGDDKYAIENIYVKPYAACRHCHSAIECALNIARKENLDTYDINDIVVRTYKLAVFGHDKQDVEGVSAAKMSTPFGIAVSLKTKEAGMLAFTDDNVHDLEIQSLCKKVRLIEDPELTAVSPGKRGAIVRIELNNGRVFENKVEYPLGEPENPISDTDLQLKYNDLMEISGVDSVLSEKISRYVWNLKNDFSLLLNTI